MSEYREPTPDVRESGASILHKLEKTSDYVFHGSKTADIREMKINQPYNWEDGVEKEDGPPCVATSRFADAAIFRALVYDDRTRFGQRDDGSLHMGATQKAMEMARSHQGYVYVFERKNFVPRDGDDRQMEWRSHKNEVPVQVITVGVKDLPENIDILPPPERD